MQADWQTAIRAVTHSLPGCVPYDNRRPLRVPGRFDRWRLGAFLIARFPHIDPAHWRQTIADELILKAGTPLRFDATVHAGDALECLEPGIVEPPVSTAIEIVEARPEYLAINKPAPLPVHPSGRFNKNTLLSFLRAARPQLDIHPVHRLDAETTGLQLMAIGQRNARAIQLQFSRGEVRKTYLALVQPAPSEAKFVVEAPISRAPRIAGTRAIAASGRPARTRCTTLERYADGTALLEVTPETGRTHQIRLHLRAHGCPIVGDRPYREPLCEGDVLCEPATDSPLCLHAARLGLRHPSSAMPLELEAPAPAWASRPREHDRLV